MDNDLKFIRKMFIKTKTEAIHNLINKFRGNSLNNFLIIRCLENKLNGIEEEANSFVNDFLISKYNSIKSKDNYYRASNLNLNNVSQSYAPHNFDISQYNEEDNNLYDYSPDNHINCNDIKYSLHKRTTNSPFKNKFSENKKASTKSDNHSKNSKETMKDKFEDEKFENNIPLISSDKKDSHSSNLDLKQTGSEKEFDLNLSQNKIDYNSYSPSMNPFYNKQKSKDSIHEKPIEKSDSKSKYESFHEKSMETEYKSIGNIYSPDIISDNQIQVDKLSSSKLNKNEESKKTAESQLSVKNIEENHNLKVDIRKDSWSSSEYSKKSRRDSEVKSNIAQQILSKIEFGVPNLLEYGGTLETKEKTEENDNQKINLNFDKAKDIIAGFRDGINKNIASNRSSHYSQSKNSRRGSQFIQKEVNVENSPSDIDLNSSIKQIPNNNNNLKSENKSLEVENQDNQYKIEISENESMNDTLDKGFSDSGFIYNENKISRSKLDTSMKDKLKLNIDEDSD